MRYLVFILILLGISFYSFAQKAKIKYEYKKYERFDFTTIDVEGSKSSPGELSIPSRKNIEFKNKLPERKNFNREMKRAIDIVI